MAVNSAPDQLGTYHMVSNSGLEPQRTNNFEVQFTNLGSLKSVNGKSMPTNASQLITLSVDTYSAPQVNITPITVHYGNNSLKFAGKPEFPASSITLVDYIGVNIERILSAWQSLVYNTKTQKIGNAVDYKRTGYLIEYDPSGGQARQWQLNGCWPSQLQLGEYSQEGNAVRKISMQIEYDHVVPLD